MTKVYKKPSFDKHADNLLQSIDNEWKQDVKQDELVLTFTVGAKRERGLPPSLLQLLEVTPSSQSSGTKSFLDPKPCSYLDCSGIKFGASTDSTFTSLVILKKYLEKIKYVKILIFVPYNKLMSEGEPDHRIKWTSTLFSCPAIHLLNENPHLAVGFGLVVVQQVESKPSGKNFTELRNAFIEQIKVIRNNIFMKDPSPELKLHLDFLKLIIRKDINFLLIQQEQKYHWDGSVKSLINIKSPPGIKIINFHQQYLRVTNKISGNTFLSILKKVHDGQHFAAISSRLYKQSIFTINQLIASTLHDVLKQYSVEYETVCLPLPKRKNHAVELVGRLDSANEFCKHRISSGSLEEFMELINLLDYPLDNDLHEKLSTYFMQLTYITDVSKVLDIEIEQLKYQVNLKKECEVLLDKVKKKIFPKLAVDLQNERQEVCIILRSAYQTISQNLIDFYHNQLLPKNLSREESRQNAIEMLCKAEELLEILEPETSSTFQVTVYKKLCNWPEYKVTMSDLLGGTDIVNLLEDQHKSLECTLQLRLPMLPQFQSCC